MTTRKATKKLCAGAAALAVGVSGMAVMSVVSATGALAQDLTRGQGVLQRRRVENEQQGIRAGGFNVYPTIAVGGEYNDNIFARADNELDALGNPNPIEDDFIYITAPEVEVESTWSRHQLRARAFTEDRRNLDFTGESNTDWGGDASFRLDVRRNTQVSVDALYDSIVEGRISSGLQDDTAFRPQIERYGGGVQVSQVINRVRGTIGANYTRIDLQSEDGSQNFRDREIGEYGARVEYIVSPSTSLFMRASYARVQYDDPQGTQFDVNGDGVIQNVDIDADGFFASPGDVIEEGLPGIRDNEALRIGVGSVFEISRLLQGEVSIGYLETQYDSPFFNDVDGIDLDIGLTWFATQLTTIRLAGGSSIEDSTIPGSSGFLNYFGQVSVDHELRRNILVSATVAYSEDDYEGIPREDQRIGADIGIDYLMNRNIAVTARYTYQDRDSTDAQIPFTQNIVYLGLRGQI